MTLRARLTAAFLAVVLGPVLLGAVFVGVTVASVGRSGSTERLDVAAVALRTAVSASCERLRAAAQAAAMLATTTRVAGNPSTTPGSTAGPAPSDSTEPGGSSSGSGIRLRQAAAQQIVDRHLAASVRLTAADGSTGVSAGVSPPQPWADCTAPAPAGRYGGLRSQVEIHDTGGRVLGTAAAVDPIDRAFVGQLAGSSGVAVTLLGSSPLLSTEAGGDRPAVVATATALGGDATGQTSDGRYVRRVDPQPGQPLTLALSVPRGSAPGLFTVLVAVILGAGLVAVVTAWWLARSTTRPLTELSLAVDRVADGDLAARVPVRGRDEVGRLGTMFNRMTREMQGYVQALTASRDQLRRQLGVLGDTLSSTHDLNRILQVILQTATTATGAQAGVVLLAEPTSGALVGQCAEGLVGRGSPMDVTDLRVRLGEGLLGTVAASGEPRRGRVDRDGPPLSEHEPRCLTYVAVPFDAPGAGPTTGLEPIGELTAGGRPPPTLGLLALYDRHGFDEFDDADVVMLRTFAGQAAVALDNVRVHEEAQRASLTDALTGLSNYRYLRESLRREVERASRFGHTLSVLVLDLDHFKEINDTYGHATGDAVLAEFARRVRAEIREVDFAFRQGGEEFVVLLPETDAVGAEVVAGRLGEAVRATPVLAVSHQSTRPLRVRVTVSVGAAVYPDHGETGLAVLEAADDALYAAKAAGRDTFRMASAGPARDARPALCSQARPRQQGVRRVESARPEADNPTRPGCDS